MNAKFVLLTIIGCGIATILTAGEPSGPTGDNTPQFQGTTNIVFIYWTGGTTKNALGQEIPNKKTFAVNDPKEIGKLIASIHHLAPGMPVNIDPIYAVKFQRPSGEINASIYSSGFDVIESEHPYRDHLYAMPPDFYAEFKTIAEQHGWQVK